MPRIPTRTEPYTSPSRQHRHYKTKRDLILRSLGKASYINGCQFAVTFISARGDVETYGSEICSERLNELFDRSVLDEIASRVRDASERRREEAVRNGDASDGRREASVEGVERESNGKLISVSTGAGKRRSAQERARLNQAKLDGRDSDDGNGSSDGDVTDCADNAEEELEETQQSLNPVARSPSPNPLTRQRTSVLMEAYMNSHQMASAIGFNIDGMPEPFSQRSLGREDSLMGRAVFATPTRRSNQSQTKAYETPQHALAAQSGCSNDAITPQLPMFPAQQLGSAFETPGLARSRSNASISMDAQQNASSQAHVSTPTPSQSRSISIAPHELMTWYSSKFDSLQQQTCKVVVKAWIKVIEPKKQTRYPYNKGNEGKPPWWPQDLRHKEPDHLVKFERTQLAIAILRSDNVKVSQLEISTAENLAYIAPGKMRILRELYKAAKEDEHMREVKDETSDIIINVSKSPPLSYSKIHRTSSSKSNSNSTIVKTEFPATLPRAGLRTNADPFASPPIATASGSTSTIASWSGDGMEMGLMDINGNRKMAFTEPAPKKRKLTHNASLSLGNVAVALDIENVNPKGSSTIQMPTPTKPPGTTKRSRSNRHPGPVAIGTVQLDENRPNTVLGIRVNGHNPNMMASNNLGSTLTTNSSGSNPQWQNPQWSLETSMMSTGVPVLVDSVGLEQQSCLSTFTSYGIHGPVTSQAPGSRGVQPVANTSIGGRLHGNSWEMTPGLPQSPALAKEPTSFAEGSTLVDQAASRTAALRRGNKRVLGESRSAGNQASPIGIYHSSTGSGSYDGNSAPNQLAYAFFDDQSQRHSYGGNQLLQTNTAHLTRRNSQPPTAHYLPLSTRPPSDRII